MGRKNKKKKKQVSTVGWPKVSVCTPTYNRRTFIPLIKCYQQQNYPKELLEWIVVDDGDDPVGDLFKVVETKNILSKGKNEIRRKRKHMHEKCTGDIIVYMDDDDYYPPERIRHAVLKLNGNKCFMRSEIYIYFKHIKTI